MTEPQTEHYSSDASPGFFSTLRKKTGGRNGVRILTYTAIAGHVLTIPGMLLIVLYSFSLKQPTFIFTGMFVLPYFYIFAGSMISSFLLPKTTRISWILFTSVLSLTLLLSVLLFSMIGLWAALVLLLDVAILIHALRPGIRAEFSVSPAVAWTTAVVPVALWIFAIAMYYSSLQQRPTANAARDSGQSACCDDACAISHLLQNPF